MRVFFPIITALLCIGLFGSADAAGREPFTVWTSGRTILVEGFVRSGSKPCPAVIIVSGSKGFGAPAYDEIGRAFNATGLDAFLVHALSPADLDVIASAGNARARIGYYAKRLPSWTAAVQDVVAYLNTQPRYAGRVGVLGISLGAQIASTASANRNDIGALVLVDGGFPKDYSKPVRSLPPLHMIWGGADQTFPLSIGQELLESAQRLGEAASLDVYEGGAHDFFLRSGTRQANSAHQSAANFLAAQLSQK